VSQFIRIAFLLEGFLFIGLGIPLALHKISPNRLYGFRTSKTLANREVWYTVNRSCGRDLESTVILPPWNRPNPAAPPAPR
jgi:hypothetical protein